jgi:hypothetical protein
MDDAVQEPEGGIDTTLAAAFAGIREKIAETADDKKKRAPKKADDGESATEAIEEALAEAAPEAPAEVAAETPADQA